MWVYEKVNGQINSDKNSKTIIDKTMELHKIYRPHVRGADVVNVEVVEQQKSSLGLKEESLETRHVCKACTWMNKITNNYRVTNIII